MLVRRLPFLLVLSLAAALLAAVPANAACALSPPRITLSGFALTDEPRPFFMGDEGGQTVVTVNLSGGCGGTMIVDYAMTPGTAVPGEDYTPTQGTISQLVEGDESVSSPVSVSITSGVTPEAIVESASFQLTNPRALGVATPSVLRPSAPVLIVDEEGAPRMGFEGVPYSQSETFQVARIPVFRAGPTGTASVNYTIAPDPSAPATPGQDYSGPASGTITFSGAERFKTIDLGVVNDEIGEGPERLIITLTNPSTSIQNAQMTFTIEDNEESVPPTSRLHHPRHKWLYAKSDYRIREVHIFTHDNPGGAGVTGAQFALRRNLKSGDCQWLTNSGWKKQDCQNREWLGTSYDPIGELWRYRPKQLKSSVGTKIKNYTAFSRAMDGAGNVERDFKAKRNANTFEVKRSRRR